MARHLLAGCVRFDPTTGEVHRDGAIRRLEPQPAAILALLLSRPGELITHEEIRHAVWPSDVHVNFQQSVHYGIRQIRQAIGDTARPPRVIETVPRRGYRLLAQAVEADDPGSGTTRPSHTSEHAGSGSEPTAPDLPAPSRTILASLRTTVRPLLLATVLVLVWLAERRPNDHHRIAVTVLRTVHGWLY